MDENVLDRIRRGELEIWVRPGNSNIPYQSARSFLPELLQLAELGERMKWIDGKPPEFGPDERKWIIFEYLTPFTRATSYVTAVWLGTSYSEVKVKLARKWMLLPEPPKEG